MAQTKPIIIKTIGDSLTEGNGRESVLGKNPQIPGQYQNWLYHAMIQNGFDVEVTNYGIGGQLIHEICGRMNICTPANFIITMGGTNNVWRYSGLGEEIYEDMWQELWEQYTTAIPKVIDTQKKQTGHIPIVIINAIPPIGETPRLAKTMQGTLLYINEKLEKAVQAWNKSNVVFCDVHKAMRLPNMYANPKLVVADGVHFTPEGNRVVGETVAKKIIEILSNLKKMNQLKDYYLE